ncbi:MAG: hypothetical protein ACOCUV_00720 [bacterium]
MNKGYEIRVWFNGPDIQRVEKWAYDAGYAFSGQRDYELVDAYECFAGSISSDEADYILDCFIASAHADTLYEVFINAIELKD